MRPARTFSDAQDRASTSPAPQRQELLAPVSAATGLTSSEARLRLARYGPNTVSARRPDGLLRRVGRQLADPLILVLLVAAALTVATGDVSDAVVIGLVVVVNTAVGVAQEVRADRAVAALTALGAPQARVVRDGEQKGLPAAEVVPGDLLVLGEGDLVAADADLVQAEALLVDESSLTGESVPVDKVGLAAGNAGETTRVSSGTAVVRGRGLGLVTATGSRSAVGRLAALLRARPPATPLQRRLHQLGRTIALVVAGLCVLVGVLGLLRGQELELMAVTAISLAVAAVPESLPAVVTLSLALGARRMAAAHAIVRRLPAVETLGSVSVLATDKTGTLTQGRMQLQRVWTVVDEAEVDDDGALVRSGRAADPSTDPDVEVLLRSAALCCDAAVGPATAEHPGGRALGDPTEVALLVAAARFGVRPDTLAASAPRVAEHPFDSRRKRMTTVHLVPDGYLVVCKGGPEVLLQPGVVRDGPERRARALAEAEGLAGSGLRVLAVATTLRDTLPVDQHDAESGLDLVGLVGVADPVKDSAADTIDAFHAAGVRTVLISGDHPATAAAVAAQVGITGSVLDARHLPEGRAWPLDATVVSRATPEQKVALVDAYREAGEIIAMTGDGVNDAPALRHADVGVAMGERGTEVARQAADLVLADDNLATMVTAVAEGRRIYANVRRFLLYGLSGGCAEVLVMLLGPFLGLPLPLLPAQILWINLMTHGLVGVALGAEPGESDAMNRPPRPATESVLGDGLWKRALRLGVLLTGLTLLVAVWADRSGEEWQTMTFLTLGAVQLGVALALRAQPRTWANPLLLVAVTGAALLLLAGTYLGTLAGLLGTEPVLGRDLLVVGAAVLVAFAGVRLERRIHPR